MSALLPDQEVVKLVSLRRVLRRHRAWAAGLGSARLELEECACRDEQNRGGHGDPDSGNERDKCVMKGLHADGH
jgi:hypothetical protein